MEILDGKVASAALTEQTALEIAELRSAGRRVPGLKAIIVGNNPASEAYIGRMVKMCDKLGYESDVIRFELSITESELLSEIAKINADPKVDGLLVQLPLPEHIDEFRITQAIDPRKDVDAFHPANLGRLLLGRATYFPATPMGIMELIKFYKLETSGKHMVVLGRSHIVGLPIANMLVQKGYPGDCTVTICHSRTKNLHDVLRQADILIVAMGRANFVQPEMVKEGAVVIDVGINRIEAPETKKGWKLVGDVDFDAVAPKCSYITPVPGGVGPMTIICLMRNTLNSRLGGFQ